MKKHILTLLAVLAGLVVSLRGESPDLRAAFTSPLPEMRPGCYWYGINDNISQAGITRDLEAMARVGIGWAYLGHIYHHDAARDTPVGEFKCFSPASWEALQWAVKQAGRVGLDICFFNSPGWSQSGGPWIKPSQSMRYLGASETVIEGGRRIEQVLPVPQIKTFPMITAHDPVQVGERFTAKDFQDVRVVTFRQPKTESANLDMGQVQASSPTLRPLAPVLDCLVETSVKLGPKPQVIDFVLDGTVPVQRLRLDPSDRSFTLTCEVEDSEDGKTFRKLDRHVEERGHQGPHIKDPILVPFPPTQSRHLRVTLSANSPVFFSALALSRRTVLAGYVRKQLGEVSPLAQLPWEAYVWPTQPAPAPRQHCGFRRGDGPDRQNGRQRAAHLGCPVGPVGGPAHGHDSDRHAVSSGQLGKPWLRGGQDEP